MRGDFQLGTWLVQPQLNRLRQGEEEKKIEPRVMDLLLRLEEAAPKVVSREELLQRVWGGAFVTDEVLTTAVWQLRTALGDRAREPRYLETIRGRGYRLMPRAEPISPPRPRSATPEARAANDGIVTALRQRPRCLWRRGFPALAAMVAGLLLPFALRTDLPKALEIDHPKVAQGKVEIHLASARLNAVEGDLAAGETNLRSALAIHPQDPQLRERLAWLLALEGRDSEALEAVAEARRLAPASTRIQATEARIHYIAHRFEKALELTETILEERPDHPAALLVTGLCQAELGNIESAFEALVRVPARQDLAGSLAFGLARIGESTMAQTILEEMAHWPSTRPYQRALGHTGLGNRELAIDWLRQAAAEGSPELLQLKTDPKFDGLRDHPDFGVLLASRA